MLAFDPPPIFGLGTAGGFEFYIQNRGEGGAASARTKSRSSSSARCNTDPQLGGAQTLWRANVPQLYVDVDREKAKALGVPIDEVFNTLSRDARQLLRQRLQQVRPHLAGADVGRAAATASGPTTSARVCVRSDERRDGAAARRWRRSSTRRARIRSIASTTCRR